MALRNIVIEGDSILRKRCKPVTEVDDRIRTILDDMLETMRSQKGVGIAAPQVGILRRMFITEPEPDRVYELINPEIISVEGSQEVTEGCLSVPGYVGVVERPQKVVIKALDKEGMEVEYEFTDFDAVVACHEFDHLEGIIYTDKARDIQEVTAEGEKEKQ